MAFRFKQFSVIDKNSTLKVGTDAVLLGAWAGSGTPENILDIGTGCGLLSLMLAQRFKEAKVTGIDIHEGSVRDASENFAASAWAERLRAKHLSLQEFSKGRLDEYDLIISNPPFFNNALLPSAAKRKLAKHSGELSFHDLALHVKRLLKARGSFSLILSYESKDEFRQIAEKTGFYLHREMIIFPVKGKKANRYLSEWGTFAAEPITEELSIRNKDHIFSREYIELTKEFYLAH